MGRARLPIVSLVGGVAFALASAGLSLARGGGLSEGLISAAAGASAYTLANFAVLWVWSHRPRP